MNVIQLLRKKRDGEEISKEEISFFIKSLANGDITESQIGAFLMAVYIRGLTDAETVNLTRSMVLSGIHMKWDTPGWESLLVDKHSTGGVGDKISLILAPVMAACGLKVPMISGRSLEYTGGTLDKLEAIPGYIVDLDRRKMQEALENAGCFISATTPKLCPADRVMYKVRDITATVDYLNLIVSSIISKKVASGTKFLVVDVKVGRATFCKTIDSARSLARQLINVSAQLGLCTHAVLSRMDEPLGSAVGNALEVAEAVQCLSGNMAPDIGRLVTVLGSKLLEMTGYTGNAEMLIAKVLKDGSALECFRRMLIVQGVSEEVVQQLLVGKRVLPSANHTTEFTSTMAGWVSDVNALSLGLACLALGAGRTRDTDVIDPSVGLVVHKHKGDAVADGELWLTVHHNAPLPLDLVQTFQSAITVEGTKFLKPDIFMEIIT